MEQSLDTYGVIIEEERNSLLEGLRRQHEIAANISRILADGVDALHRVGVGARVAVRHFQSRCEVIIRLHEPANGYPHLVWVNVPLSGWPVEIGALGFTHIDNVFAHEEQFLEAWSQVFRRSVAYLLISDPYHERLVDRGDGR